VEPERTRLRLSEFDQALFDTLESNRWLNPVEMMQRRMDLVRLFMCDGDLFYTFRLRQWAKHHTRTPALQTREYRNSRNEFTNVEYRLNPHGGRLRVEGLHAPQEAPSMFIGGCKLYAKERTWVRRIRREEWWIEEFQTTSHSPS